MGRRRIKFYKYYNDWINTYKRGLVADTTFDKYLVVSKWFEDNCSDLELSEMTRTDVQRIINKYGETHEKDTTSGFFNCFRASLQDAVYEGWITKDPTYKISITSQVKSHLTRVKYLESEDAMILDSTFLDDAKKEGLQGLHGAFCDFLLRTGLRYAEGLGVTKQDIEKMPNDVAILKINKTWNYKNRFGEKFMPTKNKSSNRSIIIDQQAYRDLAKYFDICDEGEPIFVKAFTENRQKTVWKENCLKRKGYKYAVVYNSLFNSYLAEKCNELGLPRISVHGLRHTHASLMIASGVSIQSVAKRLGHSNTVTTQKTYIHLLDTMARKDELKLMGIMASMNNYHKDNRTTKHLLDSEVKLLGDAYSKRQ